MFLGMYFCCEDYLGWLQREFKVDVIHGQGLGGASCLLELSHLERPVIGDCCDGWRARKGL